MNSITDSDDDDEVVDADPSSSSSYATKSRPCILFPTTDRRVDPTTGSFVNHESTSSTVGDGPDSWILLLLAVFGGMELVYNVL